MLPCDLDVILGSLLGLLMEYMEHINGLRKFGYIQSSPSSSKIDAYLINTLTDARHGLEIQGHIPLLHAQ